MTEIILFCTAWYAVGLFLILSWWRKDLDVELGIFIVMLFASLIGPMALLFHLSDWLDRLNTVIIRKKE